MPVRLWELFSPSFIPHYLHRKGSSLEGPKVSRDGWAPECLIGASLQWTCLENSCVNFAVIGTK